MELSWTTFTLEIVNFLVLVWILKRFLYKPVLDVIERRKAAIAGQIEEAATQLAEARQLQEKYQGRLAEWEKERQQSRQALVAELQAERAKRLEELQRDLDRDREKAGLAIERRQAETLRELEETALHQGARFATRLLERAAGPDTHERLVQLLISELSDLSSERIAGLRNRIAQNPGPVTISSAFTLDEAARGRLEQALAPLLPEDAPIRFDDDPELLAGLEVQIGAWVLAANLRDELEGFGDLAHDN
jgi:F-type H+-transporting ATPase subunit b